jgi:phosphate/sulfate permease
MTGILMFLQIAQILGTWIKVAIVNFHIVSIIILLWNLLDRIIAVPFRDPHVGEIIAVLYLTIWYYFKRRNKEKKAESQAVLKIENNNTVHIYKKNESDEYQKVK